MKYKIINYLLTLLIIAIPVVSAYQTPVYGVLPDEGVFYKRYSTYDTTHLGDTQIYDRHSIYHVYKGAPDYHPRKGWYTRPRFTITHHLHRPKLYPGIYKTHPIW